MRERRRGRREKRKKKKKREGRVYVTFKRGEEGNEKKF
jgi:hypothetical protein